MANLDQLMQLPGILAAFEFTEGGTLLNHRQAVPTDIIHPHAMTFLAYLCAANVNMARLQAKGWTRLTNSHGFEPVQQVMVIGFDWSVLIALPEEAGSPIPVSIPVLQAVVLANESANYQKATAALTR